MKKAFALALLLVPIQLMIAQKMEDPRDRGKLKTLSKKTRPSYLDIEFGIQISTFRDFASSPLFYEGRPIYLALSQLELNAKRESAFRLSYSSGKFGSESSNGQSKVKVFALNYLELFELSSINSPKFNLKWGGQFNTSANLRNNEAFGNNSDGFEALATLFASIKGSLDISSNQPKAKHNLAFGLHLGLINTSYRNGFIYTRQAPLLNQDNINYGYELHFFSGYRINTTLDYSFWLKNGNALQLSYRWDIYKTGKYDPIEMATHLLKLSLLFKLT